MCTFSPSKPQGSHKVQSLPSQLPTIPKASYTVSTSRTQLEEISICDFRKCSLPLCLFPARPTGPRPLLTGALPAPLPAPPTPANKILPCFSEAHNLCSCQTWSPGGFNSLEAGSLQCRTNCPHLEGGWGVPGKHVLEQPKVLLFSGHPAVVCDRRIDGGLLCQPELASHPTLKSATGL